MDRSFAGADLWGILEDVLLTAVAFLLRSFFFLNIWALWRSWADLCHFKWFFNEFTLPNYFLHWGILVWQVFLWKTFWCFCNDNIFLNPLGGSQSSHMKFLSTVHIPWALCFLNCNFDKYFFTHLEKLNFFSGGVLLWFFRQCTLNSSFTFVL